MSELPGPRVQKRVQFGYAVSEYSAKPQHILIDEYGMIFYPGNAWVSKPYYGDRLVMLPGLRSSHDWYNGWWETNWKLCPDWAWCYGMTPVQR